MIFREDKCTGVPKFSAGGVGGFVGGGLVALGLLGEGVVGGWLSLL